MTTEPGSTAASEATSSTAVTECDKYVSRIRAMAKFKRNRPLSIDTDPDIAWTLIHKYAPQSTMHSDTLIEMTELFREHGGTVDAFTTVCDKFYQWGRPYTGNVELAVWRNALAAQLCGPSEEQRAAFLRDGSELLKRSEVEVSEDELKKGEAWWKQLREVEALISEYGPRSDKHRGTLVKMTRIFYENGGTTDVFTTVCRELKGWGKPDSLNVQLAVWQNELAFQLCGSSSEESDYPTFLRDSTKVLVASEVSQDESKEGEAFWMNKRGFEQASLVENAPSGHEQGESSTSPSWYSRPRRWIPKLDGLIGKRGG